MLHFSERLKLIDRYRAWVVEHSNADLEQVATPMFVITFLMENNLLNEEELHKYLKEN